MPRCRIHDKDFIDDCPYCNAARRLSSVPVEAHGEREKARELARELIERWKDRNMYLQWSRFLDDVVAFAEDRYRAGQEDERKEIAGYLEIKAMLHLVFSRSDVLGFADAIRARNVAPATEQRGYVPGVYDRRKFNVGRYEGERRGDRERD